MNIGKQTKKRTYLSFFLRRLIIALIIALIVGAVGTGTAATFASLNASTMDMYEFAATKAGILDSSFANGYTKGMEYYASLYSNDELEKYTGKQSSIVITEKDTGKVVATSEFTLFAMLRDYEDTGVSIFTCRDEDVVDFCYEHYKENTYLLMDEIYINGDSFIPASIRVMEYDMVTTEDKDLVAEKTFAPADSTGWTLYEKDNILNIAGGSKQGSEMLSLLRNAVEGKPFTDAVESLNDTYNTYGNIDFINFDEFYFGGKEYAIFSYGVFDFWKVYGIAVLCSVTGLLVLAVIIAAVSSYISYTKYSAGYDAEEYRRSLIDSLSHDLKTPLMAISGYAENLKSGSKPEKSAYYTDAILENTRYMNDTISSVLQLSKLENGCSVNKEPLDICALINELFAKYAPSLKQRNISLSINGSCTARADKKLLSQALENLAANAVKYTTDGGSIAVTLSQKDISMVNNCDSGLSLTCEQLCKPFSKADSSRAKNSGTGMGLSIVNRICALHCFRFEASAENGSFTAKITL